MKVHEFTLILTADPNEAESDRLYSIFNDGYDCHDGWCVADTLSPRSPVVGGSHRFCAGARQKSRL